MKDIHSAVDSAATAMDTKAPLVSALRQSRAGRETQRYDGSRRLLACTVITRSDGASGREVLLISSSKHPNEWILPKGGWEEDETIEACALREAEEEAGVHTEITRKLGELDYNSAKGLPCRLYGFELSCNRVYDQWAEQSRLRNWVSFSDARELLGARQELVAILERAANVQ